MFNVPYRVPGTVIIFVCLGCALRVSHLLVRNGTVQHLSRMYKQYLYQFSELFVFFFSYTISLHCCIL